MNSVVLQAVLRAKAAPDEVQRAGILAFLHKKYGGEITLEYCEDQSVKSGFILEVGSEVYDWTAEGRLSQYREEIRKIGKSGQDVLPLLRSASEDFKMLPKAQEVGTVLSVGDGICVISGLPQVTYGEILLFHNGIRGMVLDLQRDQVGCILFGDEEEIEAGSTVRRSGKTAGVPVSEEYLGRVVNALGDPIDGLGQIKARDYYPIETPAPGIIDRQPVTKPMETGILTIDSMFPIGRGQRELIIGDRQTGKTAIAIDTIVNQKGKDVVCIYVAIGQKASSVAQLSENLKKRGAMDYTIIVNASASDSTPLQYIAPYAGCAMGEYFMHHGKDVLIVYDDLSKHAIAYREISLLLERSPGREAYPGDVFYLHSRLLERAARLSQNRGGGSMTALPIVETQAGDVSAYIPTNIISITDGQIFLESDLFFAGQRPAVNVGLSVSRVGGDAQTKAMKKAAGTIRLDLAQYREMEIFTQFSSDLDEVTMRQIRYGKGLMELLKQPQYQPYSMIEQVVLLVAATGHVFQDVKPENVRKTARKMLDWFRSEQNGLLSGIEKSGLLNDEDRQEVLNLAKTFIETVKEK